VNSYTQYTTDANGAGLQFSRHEAIWIVVNPTNPVKLPAVHFVVSN
jgi:hypothetical protein